MVDPAGAVTQVDALETLKLELERFGAAHDAGAREPARRMLNITRDTGEFLRFLMFAIAARRMLEIGTSNGYSTLWLAEAAMRNGGLVTTIDADATKVAMASSNFERSGLASFISLKHEDADLYLEQVGAGSFDAIFIDSDRARYLRWWPAIQRAIRTGGVIVVDNAMSHPTEVAQFIAVVHESRQFTTSLVPVGKGEFLAVRSVA